MSQQYLLDGYNITHQMPIDLHDSLEQQRCHLIRFVETCRPQGSSRNKVTIVFDGQVDVYGGAQVSGLHIVFTSNESADAMIKRKVAESSNPRLMIVVTDDREIQRAVRHHGARVLAVKNFLKQGRLTQKSQKKNISLEFEEKNDKDLSWRAKTNITKECEKIWLKKKS